MSNPLRRALARLVLAVGVFLPKKTLDGLGGILGRARTAIDRILAVASRGILGWSGNAPIRIRGELFLGRNQTMAHALAPWLGPRATNVLDVGARWGGTDAWWRLSPIAGLIGFELDADECARLNARLPADSKERYIPLALGRHTGTALLYLAQQPACSSLYPPDPAVFERYPQCSEIRTVAIQPVPLTSLDEWWMAEGRPDVSFIKLDTQGSELDILAGGSRLLEGCVGCEVEVEFSPMYQGQPLFHEVDRFLREQGFALWQLDRRCHYSERPQQRLHRTEEVHYDGAWLTLPAGSGRLFGGNAIYFKDYRALPLTPEGGKTLFILASLLEAAGDWDGACACLRLARKVAGEQVPPAVSARLGLHLDALSGPAA